MASMRELKVAMPVVTTAVTASFMPLRHTTSSFLVGMATKTVHEDQYG